MKNWQKKRNYRKIRLADGTVKHIITVYKQDVEVTKEVFEAYALMDRRERYLDELDAAETIISIEKMIEDEAPLEELISDQSLSAEDVVIQNEEDDETHKLLQRLPEVLARLSLEEHDLITALYFNGVSAREYARKLGVYHRTIIYRRDNILKKLKVFLKLEN